MRGILFLLLGVLIGVLVFLLLVSGFYAYQVYAGFGVPSPTPVAGAPASPAPLGQVTAEGEIVPRQQAKLAFKYGGRVTQVRVEEGDTVKTGDILIRLDDTEAQNQVAQAEAALDVAEKQLARLRAGGTAEERKAAEDAVAAAQAKYNDALNAGVDTATKAAAAALSQAKSALAQMDPSPEALAVTEAQVRQARAALDAAKYAAQEAALKAPFAGIIGQVSVSPGDFVTPGIPVLIIGDLSGLAVESNDISDLDVARVKTGQPVNVTLNALPGRVFHGTVTRIAPMAVESRGYKVFHLWVDLKEGVETGLRWGMDANIEIPIEANGASGS